MFSLSGTKSKNLQLVYQLKIIFTIIFFLDIEKILSKNYVCEINQNKTIGTSNFFFMFKLINYLMVDQWKLFKWNQKKNVVSHKLILWRPNRKSFLFLFFLTIIPQIIILLLFYRWPTRLGQWFQFANIYYFVGEVHIFKSFWKRF